MPKIYIQDYDVNVDFPDTMSQDEMGSVLKQNFPSKQPLPSIPKAVYAGFVGGAKETAAIPERIAYQVNQALARRGIGYVPVEEKPKSWIEAPSWAAETLGKVTGVTAEAEKAAQEAHPIAYGLGGLGEAIPEFMAGGGAVTKGFRGLGLLSNLPKAGEAVEKLGILERAGQAISKAIPRLPAELVPKLAVDIPTFAGIEGLKRGEPLQGAAMGAVFPLTQIPVKTAYRILAGGIGMGGLTAIEGGKPEDIALSTALGGFFNALSPSLQKSFLAEVKAKSDSDVNIGDLETTKHPEVQKAIDDHEKELLRRKLALQQGYGISPLPEEGKIQPSFEEMGKPKATGELKPPAPPAAETPKGKETITLQHQGVQNLKEGPTKPDQSGLVWYTPKGSGRYNFLTETGEPVSVGADVYEIEIPKDKILDYNNPANEKYVEQLKTGRKEERYEIAEKNGYWAALSGHDVSMSPEMSKQLFKESGKRIEGKPYIPPEIDWEGLGIAAEAPKGVSAELTSTLEQQVEPKGKPPIPVTGNLPMDLGERKIPETKIQREGTPVTELEMAKQVKEAATKKAQGDLLTAKKPTTELSLAQWVRRKFGGISDKGMAGEVKRLERMNLIKKGGESYDKIRELAVNEFEGITKDTTLSEFIDLVEQDATAQARKSKTGRVWGKTKEPILLEHPRPDIVLGDYPELTQEGTEFKIDNEKFKVQGKDAEGDLIIKDGVTYKVDPVFGQIPHPDIGSIKPAAKESYFEKENRQTREAGIESLKRLQEKFKPAKIPKPEGKSSLAGNEQINKLITLGEVNISETPEGKFRLDVKEIGSDKYQSVGEFNTIDEARQNAIPAHKKVFEDFRNAKAQGKLSSAEKPTEAPKPEGVKEVLPTTPQIGSKVHIRAFKGEKAQLGIVEEIIPSTEAGVEPTVAYRDIKTKDVQEIPLSKLTLIEKGKDKGGFVFGTGLGGLQKAYEDLAPNIKPTYDAFKTYLYDMGSPLYKEGMKYADFAKGMKAALGDLWDKFKQMIGRVYFDVKKFVKEVQPGLSIRDVSKKPLTEAEKRIAGYDIGKGKPIKGEFTEPPKVEPPKGAVTEHVAPAKERVQTTSEKMSEPVNPSTPDNVKQYINDAKQQLYSFWDNVKIFFDQFRQIGEYQLPKGMLNKYPEETRVKIQDYINGKIDKESLADISIGHLRIIENVKSRQGFEYGRGQERDKEIRINALVKRLYDKLKIFPDDVRKNIQSYLGGKLSLQDLPVEARGISSSIRERTITLGKMAVKAGTLDSKVFEANKGTWVHYIYAKHILGEEPVFRTGGVGMDLGYTIGRMDAVVKDLGNETYQVVSKGGKQYTKAGLTLEEAQKEQVRIQKGIDYKRKEIGFIEDASISVPMGWGKVLIDMSRGERFKQITEDPNIVWQPSRLKIDGKPITIGDLMEEWQTFKEIVGRGGATPETIARYEKLSTVLLEAQEAAKQVPKDFVQMPTGKRWGDLSGAFVKKAVYNDLMPLYKSTQQEVGSLYQTITNIEAKGMAWFKAGKVALNPPTAFRNMVSMILQTAMRPEGKMVNVIPYYIKSVQEHLNNGRLYIIAKRDGIFTSNFTQGELKEILDEFINAQKKGGSFVTILNTIGKLTKYYGKIDDIGKLAIYMESLDSGMSRARAAMEANKWGMDYSVISPSVKMLRKHIIPFLTYQYKIAPLLLESMKSKPWLMGSLIVATPLLAQEAVKSMAGIAPREWDKLKKDLPDYISKNKNYMMLPFKSPEGNWQWVNTEYFLPWGNFMGIARDLKHGDMGEFTRDVGIGNPFIDLLAMAKSASSGRPPIDPFTRQPVYSQLDSPATQWAKLSAFFYNKWAPSVVGIDIGKTGFGAAQLTMNIGEQDKWGRTITPAQAAGRWLGVNIVTTSPEQTMRIKHAKIRELQAERSRLIRDRSITPNQRMEIQKRFFEQMRALQ